MRTCSWQVGADISKETPPFSKQRPRKVRQNMPPKQWQVSINEHGVAQQNTADEIFTDLYLQRRMPSGNKSYTT